MVTKGIIKSIDLLGNTCTVHIPFFETAGNDPIIETATVSNTPGSYNGYKVGDVVYVAFEDGSMSNPVIIGKLYLGTEKEKADPRGIMNVEESTATKKATLPADASLAADIDKSVPNTTVPYSSLSSIANNLNSLNTEVGQMDRDYGNRFKQVISSIDEQGTEFTTKIEQTNEKIELTAKTLREDLEGKLEQTEADFKIEADEISAEVAKKLNSETTATIKTLGWSLTDEEWLIKAKDTVNRDVNNDGIIDENDAKEFPIFKVTRSGVEISGDLKLTGYSKETTITYTQTDSNTEVPKATPTDEDDYEWTDTLPTWVDGKYIWQKTTITKWEYNEEKDEWEDTVASEKIVCLSGASAASYWLNCSTKTHCGTQQKDTIEVTAMLKVGTSIEQEDLAATLFYRYSGVETWTPAELEVVDEESGTTATLTHKISLSSVEDKTLEILAKRNDKEYIRETILFSPLNTPILIFNKDTGKLDYDSYGVEKISEDEVATVTATVLLNNKEVPLVSWEWQLNHCNVVDESSIYTETLHISEIDEAVDSAEAVCTATYQDNLGNNKTLSKTFTVIKNKSGKATYKIDIFNASVNLSASETGRLSEEILASLPVLTTHTLSCYYGDTLLDIEECADEYASIWESISDNKFRVKYLATNVTVQENVDGNQLSFAVGTLSDTSGTIIYELYRGLVKVATGQFEVSKRIQGVSATSYWIDYSAMVHRGLNQQDTITITGFKKFGNSPQEINTDLAIRYGWRQLGGGFDEYSDVAYGQITIQPLNFKNVDLIIETGEVKDGEFTANGYNILTYSPINTPVLNLSRDSASLAYTSGGTKIGTDTVSSIAAVYLDGQILSTGVSYEWSTSTDVEPLYDGNSNLIGSKLTISTLTSDTQTFTCTATIDNQALFREPVTLTKTFTVSKQLQGVSILSQTTYYAIIKPGVGNIKEPFYNSYTNKIVWAVRAQTGNSERDLTANSEVIGALESNTTTNKWSSTPPEHTPDTIAQNWKYWTTVKTEYSSGNPAFSTPIVNADLSGVYELAQGKTTTYYGSLEPTRNKTLADSQPGKYVYKKNLKEEDCWFDTGYTEVTAEVLATLDLASKYINYYVGSGTPKVKVTRDNYNKAQILGLTITPKTTMAYTCGALKQCTEVAGDGTATWEDRDGELVTNKLTATYINALDITAQQIEIKNGTDTLFKADGLTANPNVQIAGFNVEQNTLTTGSAENGNLIKINSDNINNCKILELSTAEKNASFTLSADQFITAFKKNSELSSITVEGGGTVSNLLTFYTTNGVGDGRTFYVANKIIFTQDIPSITLYLQAPNTEATVNGNTDTIIASRLFAKDYEGEIPTSADAVDEYGISTVALAVTGTSTIKAVTYTNVLAGQCVYIVYHHLSDNHATSNRACFYLVPSVRFSVGENFQVLADGTVYAKNLFLTTPTTVDTFSGNSDYGDDAAGTLAAMSAKVNHIEVTDTEGAIVFKADGRDDSHTNNVQIGGFDVTGNTITTGANENIVTISSNPYFSVKDVPFAEFESKLSSDAKAVFYDYNSSNTYKYHTNSIFKFSENSEVHDSINGDNIKYKKYSSTNAGVHASLSIIKVIFNQAIDKLELYLHSGQVSGSNHEDYAWASNANVSTCDFGLRGSSINDGRKGSTATKANQYVKVTYTDLTKDSYIYIAYRKGTSNKNNEPINTAADIGSFYMPLNILTPRLTIGENFEVMSDGTTYASNLYLKSDSSTTVAGELAAISANLNKLTITEQDNASKILFKADGTNTNNDEKVQIGGFKVTSNKLFAGSGTDYVEFGTEAIKLGGDDSDEDNAAPFSVTKAGYLTAESGTIGGFEITKTCLKSSNNDLQLLSNGQIIAKSGEIGGFQLASNGFIKPDHLSITSESAFFETASFNLNNDVVIYNDNTNKVDNAYTSYITTTGKRHFEIKNAGGAGIRFKADSANEAVTQNITFSYKRYNAPSTEPGSEYATIMDEFLDIEYKIDGTGTLISPLTFILYYRYTHGMTSWVGDDLTTETKEISVTIPVGQNSGTCGTVRIFITTDVWNYCEMHGISTNNSTNNSDFSETAKISTVNINTSNNILYSLGSFCPFTTATADSGYLLGDDSHVWRTIRAYTASITTSDRREKNNIKSLETRHEDFFDGLVPVTFIYEHADSGRTHLGFIAQDVEKALLTAGFSTSEFAGLCIGNDDNKTYGLRYEEFIALNTNQIQKLKKRVADQEARITELEDIIKKLKTE